MSRYQPILPSGRAALVVDVVLVAWTIAWATIGLSVGREVRGLADLSDTVASVGRAAEESGKTIASLDRVPLVGGNLSEPADDIQEAGRSAQASGRSSRESVENLSLLLGLSIALIPSVPLLALYVPWRSSLVRERRSVRGSLRSGIDGSLEEFLARRAAEHLPYHRLRAITPHPWRDLQRGTCNRLAAAELQRLGLRREARALIRSQSHP